MSKYDIIFLGSSPDALTAAAYAARDGRRVLVLEPTSHLGGAVSTAQFAEGFLGDVSFTSGRLDSDIVTELNLHKHGLELIERDTISSLLPDGRSFTLSMNVQESEKAISSLSAADAKKYPKFVELLKLATDFLRTAYSITPPSHPTGAAEQQKLAELVSRLRGYGKREMSEVIRLLVMPVRDLLDEWFESAELKGLLGSVAVRGITRGPFASGSTFNLLHHLAIGDGLFRASARGGVGAINQALAAAARAYGAEVRTDVGDMKVVITDGAATGVRAGKGSFEAAIVVSDFDARQTFQRLVPPWELEPEFNRAVRFTQYKGSVARINFALRELPRFGSLSDNARRGTLVCAPSLAHLERAFDNAKYGSLSNHPFLEVTMPSLDDPTLAPDGKHVMSVWFQYAPYGTSGFEPKDLVGITLKQLSVFVPNLRELVLHSDVLTPRDFEKRFHLTEGQLYGGEMSLSQVFSLRPIPGYAQYKSPIDNLYLCGPSTHPGGGISGMSGRNMVKDLLKDPALAQTTTACGAS